MLGLLACPSIKVLDISDNYIEDERVFEEVLYKMPNLRVLYMQGNPVTKNIRNYRKTLTHRIQDLKYLDDRPVFEDDRRYAEAFARGGLQEEKEERARLKKEKDEAHWRNHQAFKDMIKRAREEKRVAEEAKAIVQEGIQEDEKQKEADFEEHREAEEKERAQKDYEAEFAKKREEKSEEKVEEEPPALEEVTAEQLQEEREQANIKKKEEAFIPWDENCQLPEPTKETIEKKLQEMQMEHAKSENEPEYQEPATVATKEEEKEELNVKETDLEELDWYFHKSRCY